MTGGQNTDVISGIHNKDMSGFFTGADSSDHAASASVHTDEGNKEKKSRRRGEVGHCLNPGTCDIVLCFFIFKKETRENHFLLVTLIITKAKNFN